MRGIGWIVAEQALEDQVGSRRQAHRRTGMAVADLLYRIHGERANRVHGPSVDVGPVEFGVVGHRRRLLSGQGDRGDITW